MVTLLRILFTIIGAVIVLQCLTLMTADKFNFGTLVPLIIGVLLLAHGLFWTRICAFLATRPRLRRGWQTSWGIFGLWLISFLVFAVILQQRIDASRGTQPPIAAMIVLGTGTVDGKPSAALIARLDAAAALAKQQPAAWVVTSGGLGFGRSQSEGEVMARYLVDTHHLAPERLLIEGKSTSTETNFAYSAPLLAEHGIDKDATIAIVTNDFHTVRAAAIARHQGFSNTLTVASETPLSIRYNAWFREYFAFVSGWLLNEY
ncbi:YdcF family protein [Psychrobacter aestuarii]|uniref:YdcF family protein n=1 Tax=Psychrobacter aestuarii TaxID=556327 RepID=A0ABP3F9J3_9GAMM|nr:YdcF family protein [Psychrobacter aestuarii]